MFYAKSEVKSYILIVIQFSAIAILLFNIPVLCSSYFLLSIQIAGVFLGIWALESMGSGNINIPPDLKVNARFIYQGPYSLIRHPMYTAIILALLPLLIEYFTIVRLVTFLLLIADLSYKLEWEEKQLLNRFPEYLSYQKKSSRIVPFIY